MDKASYVELIPPESKVVDVGGGANPCWRADYVVDGLRYDQRGALAKGAIAGERVTPATWIQLDLCDRTPWPFPDKYFDVALCTHVLEDLRDPIWVCSELTRVAKAGYVEVLSRLAEQSRGVEHPCYAGYHHHRWLVSFHDNTMVFRFKPHSLHVTPKAIVADVGPNCAINPKYMNLGFDWKDNFKFQEKLCFDEHAVTEELCEFAAGCRGTEALIVKVSRPWLVKVKRWVYFLRLRRSAGTVSRKQL